MFTGTLSWHSKILQRHLLIIFPTQCSGKSHSISGDLAEIVPCKPKLSKLQIYPTRFFVSSGAGLTSEPSTSERVVSLLAEIRNFQEIITKFKEMQVDPTEYACVKAILLFKTSKWSWFSPKRELSIDSCYSQRLEAAITLLVKEPRWGSFCGNHSLSMPWHYFGSHDKLGEWNHLAPLLQKGSN